MYMYYLLGFRIVRMCEETVTAALNQNKIHELMNWEETREVGRSHVFQAFDEQVLRKVNQIHDFYGPELYSLSRTAMKK